MAKNIGEVTVLAHIELSETTKEMIRAEVRKTVADINHMWLTCQCKACTESRSLVMPDVIRALTSGQPKPCQCSICTLSRAIMEGKG